MTEDVAPESMYVAHEEKGRPITTWRRPIGGVRR